MILILEADLRKRTCQQLTVGALQWCKISIVVEAKQFQWFRKK